MFYTVDGQGIITQHVTGSIQADEEATQNQTLANLGSSATHPASDFVSVSTTVAGYPLSSNVTLAKSDVRLGSVDNTADSAKPVSTAQQTPLNAKAPITRNVAGHALSADVTLVKADVGLDQVD